MAWWEDLEVVDGLYAMVVFVVVDFSEDLVLEDLVFMWLHHFVCDSWIALANVLLC